MWEANTVSIAGVHTWPVSTNKPCCRRFGIIAAFPPQDDVRVALVMEYAAGGELLHRIRKRLRLPDTEAKFYAAEIADALQYMHNEVGPV